MNNRSAILMAFGACGVGFFAARLIFRSDGTCKIEEPVSVQSPQRIYQEPRASPVPPDLERPSSRVPILTEAPLAPESPQPSASTAQATPPPDAKSDPRTLPEGTRAEMKAKRNAIDKLLQEESSPIIIQRIQDGLLEHYSDDVDLHASDTEEINTTIAGYTRQSGQGWDRTVLPRSQYPDLYELKDEVVRLDKLISRQAMTDFIENQKRAAGQHR